MSQPWKLLPLTAMAVVALVIMGLAVGSGHTASAEVHTIDVEPMVAGNDSEGSVTITSDDDSGELIVEVTGGSDFDLTSVDCTGCEEAYIDEAGTGFTIDTDAVDDDENQETITTTFSFTLDCGENEDIYVFVDDADDDDFSVIECTAAEETPTSTPGDAATVTTSASPKAISCSGTSIVTIQVRDEEGEPVPAGTDVEISTTLGSISPSIGETNDDSGNAFVFLTAPEDEGGTATVTATSGDAEGSTDVTINCGTTPTPTTAPPPTVAPGGGGAVISPPNTGSAGLADTTSGSSWLAFAGLGLLSAAAFGVVSVAKVRA